MKKRISFLAAVFIVLFYTYPVDVQGQRASSINKRQSDRADSIDIMHYHIQLAIRNLASKTISGKAVLTMDPLRIDSLTTIQLDLLKLQVDSVLLMDSGNPVRTSFFQNDSQLFVAINRKIQPAATDSLVVVHIYYKGTPQSDTRWGGFYFSGNYAYNMGVGFNAKPHNFGRCWFPCIDNFTDRAFYDFSITTDADFKAICNGILQSETPHPDGSITWNWSLAQPIPTYLVSVAVGKYEWVRASYQGANRVLPITIATVAADTAKARTSFQRLQQAMTCFESRFGSYPFDRIGYVAVPFSSGAMEHASNIAYPIYAVNGNTDYETLYAHELSHMWWGNQATCRTAEDMWLNEGWASYCEALFLECAYGKDAYLNNIKEKASEVITGAPAQDKGWYPVSGVPHSATYGMHVYTKGALMVHTLRTLMGDSAFFAACRAHLAKYYFKDVNSYDLMTSFQPFTSLNLLAFFNKWIYEPGHADIVVSEWTQRNEPEGVYVHAGFMELKYLQQTPGQQLPFEVSYLLANGTTIRKQLILQNGGITWDTILPAAVNAYWINENQGIYLGAKTVRQPVQSAGTLQLPEINLTLTVQQPGSNTELILTQHRVGPTENAIRMQGIRISPERYWTVGGNLGNGFSSRAFMAYDGNPQSYLDQELLNAVTNEDSMVLLYRPSPVDSWQVYTDLTFQPGPSKTDKIGRFWLNNLLKGEYVLGVRDQRVTALSSPASNPHSFSCYPNPANQSEVVLDFEDNKEAQMISIYTATGKLIEQFVLKSTDQKHILPIHGWNAGTYLIVASGKSGTYTRKLLIP